MNLGSGALRRAVYDVSENSVTLVRDAHASKFARGGVITVNAAPPGGVQSAAGAFLTGPTSFSISKNAGSTEPSV